MSPAYSSYLVETVPPRPRTHGDATLLVCGCNYRFRGKNIDCIACALKVYTTDTQVEILSYAHILPLFSPLFSYQICITRVSVVSVGLVLGLELSLENILKAFCCREYSTFKLCSHASFTSDNHSTHSSSAPLAQKILCSTHYTGYCIVHIMQSIFLPQNL